MATFESFCDLQERAAHVIFYKVVPKCAAFTRVCKNCRALSFIRKGYVSKNGHQIYAYSYSYLNYSGSNSKLITKLTLNFKFTGKDTLRCLALATRDEPPALDSMKLEDNRNFSTYEVGLCKGSCTGVSLHCDTSLFLHITTDRLLSCIYIDHQILGKITHNRQF